MANIRQPLVWCDNSGAIFLASNSVYHGRTKHIEIDIYFVQDKVKDGELEVRYVPTQDQVVDIMTKPLSRHLFEHMVCKLNIISRHSRLWGDIRYNNQSNNDYDNNNSNQSLANLTYSNAMAEFQK